MLEGSRNKEELSLKIKQVIKSSNMTLRDFVKNVNSNQGCEDFDSFIDRFNKQRSRKDSNYDLCYIKGVIDLIRKNDSISSGLEDEIIELWKKVERTYSKDYKKRFLELNREDLLWIANNIDKLNNIPFKVVVLRTYLACLNYDKKRHLSRALDRARECEELLKNVKVEDGNEHIFDVDWKFIDKSKFRIKSEIEVLQVIMNTTIMKEEKIKEEKNDLVKCWLDLREIDEEDMKILSIFAEYDTGSRKTLSEEQILIMGFILSEIYSP